MKELNRHKSTIGVLCQLIDCEHKTAPTVDKSNYFVVKTNSIKEGQLILSELQPTSKDAYTEWTIRAIPTYGDVIFTREAPAGESCLVPQGLNVCLGQRTVLLRLRNDNLSSEYLAYYLNSPNCIRQIKRLSLGTTVTRINVSDIKKIKISFPDLNQQKTETQLLTGVDEKIRLLKEKHALLQQYKKGVMQKLFSQEIRFKDDNEEVFPDWKFSHGNKLFSSISDKKHNSDLPILAITQEHGAIPRELINYQVQASEESVASYKVVNEGDFIISLRSFQGGIEYSRYKGICSPAYIILRPCAEIVDDFYRYYLKTGNFIQEMKRRLEGVRDGKILSYKYFSEIKLPYPCVAEQQKIAAFIMTLDKKLDAVQQQIDLTQTFKKGLLQQMFV